MNRLNVAVIGLGRSGWRIHCRQLEKLPLLYRIAAVVDSMKDRRDRAAAAYGCDTYEDYRELIGRSGIDVAVNAAPSHLHVPVTLDLLEHGFNVVCEKPLAGSAADVDRLIAAADNSGKVLATFHNMRFVSCCRQISQVLGSGVLGRIVQISISDSSFRRRWDWQTLQRFNGGNLLVLGSHALDEAIHYSGLDEMPEIACRLDRANTFGDADDYAKVFLRAPGKPAIDIEISSCDAFPPPKYRIQGTRGTLSGTPERLEWKYFRQEEAPAQSLVQEPLVNAEGEPVYCSEELKFHHETWDNPCTEYEFGSVGFYTEFYTVLTCGGRPSVSLAQVRLQAMIIEECLRSNPLPGL